MEIIKLFDEKEMVYSDDKFEIIAGAIVTSETNPNKKHSYLIVNYGWHPCCYVSVPKGIAINTNKIDCHGGVTWDGPNLPDDVQELINEHHIFDDVWWFGWDYAHYCDYTASSPKARLGKRWTTVELVTECIGVIKTNFNLED